MRWEGRWQPDPARTVLRHPLCGPCCAWLAGVLSEVGRDGIARDDVSRGRIFGAPGTGDRVLLFEDQCHICHSIPSGGDGALIDCVSFESQAPSWAALFACAACDAWVGSLADDGRSARGGAGRNIDGPYGEWPHPNLRDLTVAVDVQDGGAGATVVESCAAMGVAIDIRRTVRGPNSVLFLEALAGSDISARVAQERPARGAVLVLAGPAAGVPLRGALRAGANGWLTIPITPQQVAAALSGTLRHRLRLNWDLETALPVAAGFDGARPGLLLVPKPGVEPFAVAWMLRRFSRGYDEAAVSDGRILLFPRVPAPQIGRVRSRLARVLEGHCTVSILEGGSRPRFEAAG